MSTSIKPLEQRSQEKCALKFIQACKIDCVPNCRHFFDLDDRSVSEQDIVKRYNAFNADADYRAK